MLLRIPILISAILIGSVGANAWSPMGHHVTGVIAYELLNEADQAAVMELLTHVPDFRYGTLRHPGVLAIRGRLIVGGLGLLGLGQTSSVDPIWIDRPGITNSDLIW